VTITATPAAADGTPAKPPDPPSPMDGVRVAMRWKLLAAFASAFTLVFVFIAVWVIGFSTSKAEARLVSQLEGTSAGGAGTLNATEFAELIATVPPVPDPANPFGLGYPDSPLYRNQAAQLMRIRDIVAEANPYTYFRDPADGQLYFAASAGYLLDPPFGVTYRVPVAEVVSPATYQRMEQGLETTTDEPAYTDSYGSWISSYSPVRLDDGTAVGAIGIDYPLTYVDQIRSEARAQVLPVLLGSYLVLLLIVLVLSNALVRPLRRLTEATTRVEKGEYDLDVGSLVKSRFPDEMYVLGESFARMARKVGAREKSLTREVRRLKVEIDQAKKDKAVREITETDFFSDLTARAAEMRRRMREDDS
jgi:HAMP domain-containing protein